MWWGIISGSNRSFKTLWHSSVSALAWFLHICDLKFKPAVDDLRRGQRGSLASASLTAPLCPGGDHWWRVLRSGRLTQGERDSRRASSTHGLKDDGALKRCYDSSWRTDTGEGQVLLSLILIILPDDATHGGCFQTLFKLPFREKMSSLKKKKALLFEDKDAAHMWAGTIHRFYLVKGSKLPPSDLHQRMKTWFSSCIL